MFARCRSSRQKVLQWLMKTKHFGGFTISVTLREEIKISLHGGRAGSRRGLVGQSRGLLIYTFHKIIHVRGIPLPIWLVRTRVGGVFMELEPSQKNRAMDKQWCGLISIYANIWTSINGRIVFYKKKKKAQKLPAWAAASNATCRNITDRLPARWITLAPSILW